MIYQDLIDALTVLNTGSLTPDRVDLLTKLVCGKIVRRKPKSFERLATITTNGETTINLRTALPDFVDFKLDPNNDNKIIYSLDSQDRPIFYKLVSESQFNETIGNRAKLSGSNLIFDTAPSDVVPNTIYFPYFSLYCWEDAISGEKRETPINNDDICLLNPIFDDVLIEGVLLYISRREKEDSEYTKNVQEWEKRVNELVYYN
jgi:hypothetical protein